MSCFKVCYDDLSVDEIVTMVNDDDLPDTVLRRNHGHGVPASELFTPQMLVAGADELALTRVPTGMSTISVSSIQSLTPSRLAAAAAASGSSESDVLNDYLDAVWRTQPPRLTDVDHPLFSVNMVTYIQQMQKEGHF
ncbi:uncharacterized protein SPSK_03685 [Sporothrix schenckii 1099-18]|uniref:Uncharacterized protein n=1 Tax=Sporothrix schenckii 1099-18 TaxID=1397361 RepID=A0A0F2M032_SPOSC|nr:uncharacterized protein SPSK_03685 [Sporothrix schenckii 1099-18]KJR82120.1 hypothetical protein SPSK_03685 [Sporothrix schenckii 1099-18]